MTLEELAPYGIGTPDADGVYPDYRLPRHLKPAAPAAAGPAGPPARSVWWSDIVRHWNLVERDLAATYHVDLHDPAVLTRSWLGVRGMILGLLQEPSRLAAALEKEATA